MLLLFLTGYTLPIDGVSNINEKLFVLVLSLAQCLYVTVK